MHDGRFDDLLMHMEWADALMWKSVLTLPAARDDRRARELLYHLHSVQQAYLQLWRGQPPHVPELGVLGDLAGIAAWAQPYYGEARTFLRDTAREALDRTLALPWHDDIVRQLGTAGPTTVADTFLQVVLHSTYHRAQLATRVRELGGDAPLTDFIVWIWKQRPLATW